MRNFKFCLGAAALALAAAMPAKAQIAPQAPTQSFGNNYIGVSGGALVPDSLSVNALGFSGNVNFDPSGGGTIFAGHHFNDYLAAEAQLGYASASLTSITINGFGGSGAANGSLDNFFGFANLLVTPLGRQRLEPYIGGGLGFSRTELSIDSLGSASDAYLAADGVVGVDYALTNSLSIGARYQFVWINTSGQASTAGVGGNVGDFTGHLLTATLGYHF